MARKVFISVLGSTNYGTCKYEFKENGFISEDVRFIQEATLQMLNAKEWGTDSVGYICVTAGDRGSKELNWKDNGHKDRTSGCFIHCEGLETRSKILKLPFEIEPVIIKDGNGKEEIWEVFDEIFKLLKDNDEIYFDITHGFRYLPMLILVLSNYAKFLKNIKVKSITYGNYEARNKDNNIAPIIDIASFSVLQDWTSAANEYVEYGRTKKISKLIIEDSENNIGNSNSKSFIKNLKEIEGVFITCRSKQIKSGKVFNNFNNYLKAFKKQMKIEPLVPILDKISKTNKSFNNDGSLLNVCAAVDWCHHNNLLQQAITMGQELILSIFIGLLPDIDEKIKKKKDFRTAINSLLTNDKVFNREEKWHDYMIGYESILEEAMSNNIFSSFRQKETQSLINKQDMSYYSAFNELRNKINHGGVTDDVSYNQFEEGFIEFYLKLLDKFKEHGFRYESSIVKLNYYECNASLL